MTPVTRRSVTSSLSRREFIATTTAVALSQVAARADTARENLAAHIRIQNPVGKQMLHYVDSFEAVRRSYETGRLETDIGLLLIACRLFRGNERRLPDQLSELVNAKLLESVPIDPFSGQEVRYDSQRRLIWSFGHNEEDNGGDWDFDAEFPDGEDLVWRIPATRA